jgi:3-dehydrosphinganine reductase
MRNDNGYFRNKIALITGGSSGIGLALARQLAARGSQVWLVARRTEALESARAEIQSVNGGRCGIIPADVADAEQANAAIQQVTGEAGLPDLVINSAGITHPGYIQEVSLEIFRELMDVNSFGTVHITKAVLPGMLERGSGHIVNISSAAGFLGVFGYSAYGATKFAIRGFSDVLRAEMQPHGIRVSVVFPPDTDTPQLAYEAPLKPPETKALSGNAGLMSADAVAREILRGIQREKYIILPGAETKLLYHLGGLLGNAVYPLMDMMIKMQGIRRTQRRFRWIFSRNAQGLQPPRKPWLPGFTRISSQ